MPSAGERSTFGRPSPRKDRGLPRWSRECRREALEAVVILDSSPEGREKDVAIVPVDPPSRLIYLFIGAAPPLALPDAIL